jgi:Bacteriophage head to tail connecting protein
VFDVNPVALQYITADIALIQQRIKVGFFNDLFQMLAEQTKDMTAYEVAQRQQEKLQVLGPVIERFNNEAASKAIKRVFAIMQRRQLVPPLPQSLRNVPVQIEYISMLALAQRATATAGIERLLAVQGKMAATNPAVLDLLDDDEILREYGDQLGVTQKVFNPPEKVVMIRKQKQQAAGQAAQSAAMSHAATQITPALAMAAKNLSETDVGGGINAAQLMLGGPSGLGAGAGAPG